MRVEPWLDRAAAANGARVAIRTSTSSLTYSELLAAAEQASAWLRRHVAAGERVAIALPAGLDFAIAIHAVLRTGAVAVPLDVRRGVPQRERVGPAAALELREPIPLEGGRAGGQIGAGGHDLDAAAVVIHTSGTGGAPKPVELSYGNWLWSALGSGVALGVERSERWLCALPLSHVGGLSILVRSAVYGTTAVVYERFDTGAVLEELMRPGGATLVSLVATTLQRLLDAGLSRPPCLRCALVGGGPVPPALLERARRAGVAVRQTYGLTEACSQVSTQPAIVAAGETDDIAQPTDDAGPPLFCTRVRIAADDEILVAGPTVASGAVGPDGWLHTGDLGKLVRGRLSVVGRKADTIVSGGENVAPAEVEAVLLEHPAVSEASVLGRPDPEWGEAVVAIVVRAPGASGDSEDLRRHCAASLAAFKVPKEISFTDRLPRTPSGKLLRRAP